MHHHMKWNFACASVKSNADADSCHLHEGIYQRGAENAWEREGLGVIKTKSSSAPLNSSMQVFVCYASIRHTASVLRITSFTAAKRRQPPASLRQACFACIKVGFGVLE